MSDVDKFAEQTTGPPIDIYRHDRAERHTFGDTFIPPNDDDVSTIGPGAQTGSAGVSEKFSRADHVHPYDGGSGGGGGVTEHGLLTGLGDDDHPQYTTHLEASAISDAAITSHISASDPHAAYLTLTEADGLFLTPTEGDARYDLLGAASSGDSAHIAAADPHPQYLTSAEGNAAYLSPSEIIAGANVTVDSVSTPGSVVIAATPAGGGGLSDGDYGDIVVSGGGTVMTVDALAITTGKLAAQAVTAPKIGLAQVGNSQLTNINQNRFKGRIGGSSGSPQDMTPAEARTVLASDGGGTVNFLRADGTWAAPPVYPTQAESDTRYVNTTGDSMTGPLAVAATPTAGVVNGAFDRTNRLWTSAQLVSQGSGGNGAVVAFFNPGVAAPTIGAYGSNVLYVVEGSGGTTLGTLQVNAVSSIKGKEDVRDLPPVLAKLRIVPVRIFRRTPLPRPPDADGNPTPGTIETPDEVGLILEEVEPILPEVVDRHPQMDNVGTINVGSVTAVLWRAMQELVDEIQSLKDRIQVLETV